MPILPLANDEPFAITLGIMLYPEQGADGEPSRKALAYRTQYLAGAIAQFLQAGHNLPPEYLMRLVTQGGEPLNDIKERFRLGLIAGQTLWIAFTLGHSHPDKATWNNAIKLTEVEAARQKAPGSRTLIQEAKAMFGPVLHLWAAWCVCEGELRVSLEADKQDGLRRYLHFLAVAGAILHWGQTFVGSAAKSAPLLGGDPWVPSNDWLREQTDLMAPSPPRIPLAELNEADLKALRGRGRPRKHSQGQRLLRSYERETANGKQGIVLSGNPKPRSAATRFDKLARNFLAAVAPPATRIWLKAVESTP